jgi:outer membrane protein TolC
MDRAGQPRVPAPRRLRRLLLGLGLAGLSAVGPGCSGVDHVTPYSEMPHPQGAQPAVTTGNVQPVGHEEAIHALADAHPAAPVVPKEVPITLDALLRIAEQSNPRIGLAREKLAESQIGCEQGCRAWLPQVYAGVAYYRHEGGIQNENGTLTHSSTGALYPGLQLCSEWDVREAAYHEIECERKLWQQKAELSQVNNEVLLDAASTYVDLLAARRAEALLRELDKYTEKLLRKARDLAKEDAAADPLIQTLQANLSQHDYQATQLRQQGNAASAKLVYLLGLPPATVLVPVDRVLVPVELVDTTPPTEQLVHVAWTQGPGVRELEGLMSAIQSGLDRSYSRANYLVPKVQLSVFEGAFGAGPGATLDWDNRLDMGLQLKWNLTGAAELEFRRRKGRSALEQTNWNLLEVKGKLASGVQEAKDAILHSREQIGESTKQIKFASESYRLSDRRLEDVKGAAPRDVADGIHLLEQAHFNHLQAIQAHNKAQVRLMMFLGGGPVQEKKLAPPTHVPPPPDREEKPGEKLPAPKPKDDKAGVRVLPQLGQLSPR